MYKISQIAKEFGISRSTLLYYERVGILLASGRNFSNYRLYNKADFKRLQIICSFRQAGIGIKDIRSILESGKDKINVILKRRLQELGEQSLALHKQQRLIAGMLNVRLNGRPLAHVDKETWINMLKTAGMDEKAMGKWHAEFEKLAPEAHNDFLLSIGISQSEAVRIRKYSE